MKAATAAQIKEALKDKSAAELMELTLRLARFKKENKELLTYLLFEADDEEDYRLEVKRQISEDFTQINFSSYYYIKKTVRKILRATKKYIRYSADPQTEVELLTHFCMELSQMNPSYKGNVALRNLMDRQVQLIKSKSKKLHEDLRHDLLKELQEL